MTSRATQQNSQRRLRNKTGLCLKLPDREPSRLAADGNGFGCRTFWRIPAFVAAASRDGSRSDSGTALLIGGRV